MMRKTADRRGVASLEFCLVAAPLFTLMFVIFDLGRYAITVQSLSMLANAEARAIMIQCYPPGAAVRPASCTADLLSVSQKQGVAPFLYAGGLTPAVNITATGGVSPLTIRASQPGFTMLVPMWGTTLNAPSVSTQIPF